MALVVTIIVLIILAVISINAVFGENGLVSRAEKASEEHRAGTLQDEVATWKGDVAVSKYDTGTPAKTRDALIDDQVARGLLTVEEATITKTTGKVTIGSQTIDYNIPFDPNTLPKGPNGKPLVTEVTTTEHETIIGEDEKGNQVVVPGGFKIASDSGTTVQQGIVIEDASENQFVWIPVSNINHDRSNLIKLDDDSTVEITLGRYTFNTTTGVETKVQYASEYAATTLEAVQAGTVTVTEYAIHNEYGNFYELTAFRESDGISGLNGTNSTAKDLAGFINSVKDNKGYYFARYEASYASGTTYGVGNDSTYYKPASKVSTATRISNSTALTNGMLWNYITQGNASKASRQMYYGDEFVESDLCNSYAWDTAIVYIQAMGNSNYANAYDGNKTLKNTGETGDEKCKIFDMAGNLREWITEYSTYTNSNKAYPCPSRGGGYDSGSYASTSSRLYSVATFSSNNNSFRPLLYCKTGA